MKKLKLVFVAFFLLSLASCSMESSGETFYQRGSVSIKDTNQILSIFLTGQSNAKNTLAEQIEIATGRPTASINHGGQAIRKWFLYPFYWIETDRAFLRGRHVDYFIWFQGESDREPTYQYEVYFRKLLSEFGIGPDTIVIIIKVYATKYDCSGIREYHDKMVLLEDNWYTVDSADIPRPDGEHIDSAGQIILAERIADKILEIENQ